MSWTDRFILRPVLAAVVSLLILLLGGMGFSLLSVRETPDVESPIVTVTTTWPAADPALVESDVTEVLERELNGVEGVRTISSSSQDGASTITMEFELGRDLEAAANDVRSRVSRARKRLPDDVDEPVVEKSDALAQTVMFIRLGAEGRDLLEATEIAENIVRSRLENVSGVSGVDIFGGRVFAMRVELDAARMAARGVTVSDIDAALRAGNVDLPAGRIEGQATQLAIQLEGGLRTPEEFGALVLRSDGLRTVYLRDVARVRLGAENERTGARADGVPAATLAVSPQASANVVEVSDEIWRRLPEIEEDLPEGMSLDVIYDRASSVRTSIHDVELTLGVAFGLVVMVIFAFLRDVRSTLVPAIAIPVSVIGTFLVLWAAGFTINVFTLFGLVLSIGLVVDDAIVVLENIVRRVEEGEPVLDAALAGTRQISSAVVLTTLSLVVVFLPVIFTGGATGRLFLEFGVTVAASVALSMVVALTLTPMLCSLVLRPTAHAHEEGGWLARRFSGSLSFYLRYKGLTVLVVGLALAAGALGYRKLPTEFFPTEDRNMFIVRAEAQEGTTYDWMDARMREVEEMLMPMVPERRMMLGRVAVGRGGAVAGTNTGMIMFPLVPRAERERSQQEIVAALKGPLSQITAFRTVPIQFPTVGRGFSSPLQIVLQHSDFDTLAKQLPLFVKAMREVPGLTAVNEDLRLDRPELRLTVDRERAAAMGVPIRDVGRALQVLTGGVELSTFKRGVRQYKVIADLGRQGRDEPGDLSLVSVRARDGRMVPLSNLVRWQERSGPSTRYHYDRSPSATISANLDGITLGQAIERAQAVARETLPEGFRTALAGQSKDLVEGSSSLARMFLLALGLVYLLLAAQFNSFRAPVSIMLSVPLALAGAFAALWIMGMTMSFFAQVGLILLVGLVTKNGILIVEYARQLQEEGMEVWAAAEQATKLRFRPILMTSVATIGGAIPIAMGLSGESRSALGVAVVGGMLSATVLTLYVTPVVYAALERLGRPRGGPVAAGLALLLVSGGAAAQALTLEGALTRALEANPDVLAAEAELRAAEASADQARAGLLPEAELSATGLVSDDVRYASSGGGQVEVALGASLPLLDLSQLSDARAARLSARAEAAARDAAVEDALAAVARAFVALQQGQEGVAAAEAQRQSAARLLELAQHRVELGAAPVIDRTRAQLALRTAEAALVAARRDEEAARLGLAEALAYALDTSVNIADPAPILDPGALPDEAALQSALAQAQESRPELLYARAALEAAVAERQAASRAGLPTLYAAGEVAALHTRSGETYAPVTTLSATASMPLFEGGGRTALVRARRASEDELRVSLEAEERAVEAELRLALRSLGYAAEVLALAEDALTLASDELARAESRYAAGEGSSLEVVSAQAGLASASERRVDALAAYNLAVVGWYAARGEVRSLAR